MGKRGRRKLNKHHILPRSRFPQGSTKREMDQENIVEIDRDIHDAWHFIFGNLTPEEAKKLIDIIMQPDTCWSYRSIVALRRRLSDYSKPEEGET